MPLRMGRLAAPLLALSLATSLSGCVLPVPGLGWCYGPPWSQEPECAHTWNKQAQTIDEPAILENYRNHVESGDAVNDAHNDLLLAARYEKGDGVPRDLVRADAWYRLAAAEGDSKAMKRRDSLEGSMTVDQIAAADKLASTWNPPPSDAQLMNQLRPKSERGDADVQFKLGSLYAKQNTPEADISADMWFILSAWQGNLGAVQANNIIETRMSPAQIAEARKLASEWKLSS